MDFETRAIHNDDVPAILKLFEVSFGRAIDERTYRYFFLDNPFGRPMVELAFHGDRLVGHYSLCPARTSVFGESVPSARSMTTMTHPGYQGHGIFPLLARRLYERVVREEGVRLVWGFPNQNSHYGFVRKIGWEDLFALFYLEQQSDPGKTAGSDRVVPLSPAEFLDLVPDVPRPDSVIRPFVRDKAFYRWRYVEHPAHSYRFVALEDDRKVLAVLGEYRSGDVRHLNLVDAVVDAGDAAVSLVRGVCRYAFEEGFHRTSVWADLRHPLFSAAEKLRFGSRGPITYFGAWLPASADAVWTDPRAWRVVMGDSDVF